MAVAVATVLASCSLVAPAGPVSLEAAVADAADKANLRDPHLVLSDVLEGRRVVLVTGAAGARDAVGLFTFDRGSLERLTSSLDGVAAASPATISWSGSDTLSFAYGIVNDPTIRELVLELPTGERDFEIARPGYVIPLTGSDTDGPQGWRFVDGSGTVVHQGGE